jgi:phosphoglycerate dehydrogenase-like enzyme
MIVLVAFVESPTAWTLPRTCLDDLRRDFPQHTFLEAWDRTALERHLPAAEVAFTAAIPRQRFGSLPRLRWVQSSAAGVGGMLGPALTESPIVLTSARGVRATAIAEHVIGVTIALSRQLHVAIRRQAAHVWAFDEIEGGGQVRGLHGRRLTLVGLGAIGREVARLAAPLGLRVRAIRRRPYQPLPDGVEEAAPPDRLPDLLADTDIVVVCAALTPDTRHLIGPRALAAIRPGALLVNVGRGRLLDDEAVIAALGDGRLGGAALDVFVEEPLDPASPYWDLPNVIITPHVSGAMEDYWTPLVAHIAENLRRFEAGDPLVNVVDKAAGY